MRRVAIVIAALVATLAVATPSFADVIWIPMSTKVGQFKKECMDSGLDLYGHDDSDGHVENHGTKIKVVTNRWLEQHELDCIMDAAVASKR